MFLRLVLMRNARLSNWKGILWALALAGATAMASASEDCQVPPELAATRPGPASESTEVRVGSYLLDLRNVRDSEQSFEADIFYAFAWHDPRLAVEVFGRSLAGCQIGLSQIWNPRPVVVNERNVRRRFDDTATVDDAGRVLHVQRLQGEFTVPLDLREFPFDSQQLHVEIVARGYSPEEVAFVLDERVKGEEEILTLADWRLVESGADVSSKYLAPQDRHLAQVRLFYSIERQTRYYYLKVFLPLALIIFMSWSVFWIEPGLLPPQIGVSTSAILTLIAFQFSLSYLLPRLSYLTRADRFLIGSTFLVFGAFGEAILTSYFAKTGNEKRARAIDRWSRWLFPTLFLVVVLVSIVL